MKSLLAALLAAAPLSAAAVPAEIKNAFDVVHTPFQLSMSQQSFSTVLFEGAVMKSMSGTSTGNLPDIVVSDPFSVRVSGVQLRLSYEFDAPASRQSNEEWLVKSRRISAEIVVSRIEASQVITVVRGGTEIEIRLDGACRNVRLALPEGSASASAGLRLGQRAGSPRLELRDFGAKWVPGSWKVVSMDCSGPEGFGQRVEMAATERLRQIDPYFDSIRDALQAELDNSLSGPVALVLGNPFQAGQTVRLNAPAARNNANGDVVVRGDAYFYFQPGKGGCGTDIKGFPAEPQQRAGENSLVVPFAALKALFACTHSDGSLAFRTDSARFKGFQQLMNSYFKKQAVWPDLNQFEPNALFRFHGVSQAPPSISGEKALGKNVIQLRLQQKMGVDMHAPVSGKAVPYMKVSAFFSGPVRVSMAGGKVKITPEQSGQLSMNGRFDPSYVKRYEPNQKVDWKRITPVAQDALLEEGWSFDMPKYGVSPAVTLSARDGSLEGANYRIGFDVLKSGTAR